MDTIGVGTHQKVLMEAIRLSGNKPILELGAGDYSTPLIHENAGDRLIVTVDHNQKWLDRFQHLELENHSFLQVDVLHMKRLHEEDNTNWGVVFVDSITWETRMLAINKYKDTSDYLVIHDTGYSAEIGTFGEELKPRTNKDPGLRDFSKFFKYWREYLPINWASDDPPTVLGSNFFSLDSVIVDGMVEINSNR